MVLLDKIYIKIFNLYKNFFKSDMPTLYSVSFLVIMILMHILLIRKIISLLFFKGKMISINAIIITTILYILLGIRYYYYFDHENFNKKYINSNKYKSLIIYTLFFGIIFIIFIYL